MEYDHWNVNIGRTVGTWIFRKFLKTQNRLTPYDFLNITKMIFPNIKYFKPKVVNLRYSPKDAGVEEYKKHIKFHIFQITRSNFNRILDREIDQFKTKVNLGAGLTYIYGETLLHFYDDFSKIVKKWKSVVAKPPAEVYYDDFLSFCIYSAGYFEKNPYISFTININSDIWLEKVSKVNEDTFQHYDNKELASLNSKALLSILEHVNKTFKPDEIETWSEIDQEACEKNLPNKLVTETGFDQERIKEFWGER